MRSALHNAAANNDIKAVREIMADPSADLNGLDEGISPLVVAAAQGANDIIDLFVADPRCDINMRVIENMTALHIAAGGINVETVARLVLAGADVNAKDMHGNTAAMIAAEQMMISQHHHATHVRIMINSGRMDPTATNADGYTLVHLAAYKGRADIVEFLVDNGWDAHAVDHHGHNAVHHSVAAWNLRGDPDVAKYLVSIGVDPFLKNNDGETPAVVAKQNEHPKAVEYLENLARVRANGGSITGSSSTGNSREQSQQPTLQLL